MSLIVPTIVDTVHYCGTLRILGFGRSIPSASNFVLRKYIYIGNFSFVARFFCLSHRILSSNPSDYH
jgi:hypothetical protein